MIKTENLPEKKGLRCKFFMHRLHLVLGLKEMINLVFFSLGCLRASHNVKRKMDGIHSVVG